MALTMHNKSHGQPLALITGAYGGIGLACARRLGRNHDLILTDLEQERLDETAQTLKEEGCVITSAVAGDMADLVTLEALCAAIKEARIVTVSPGMTWTAMGRKEAEDERTAAFITSAPLPRWGKPMEIADAVEFLVSDCASFITGSDIRVDGGVIGEFHASSRV